MSLEIQTVRGISWSGISQVVSQGFQFLVKILLARLLVPEDFGILGMALVFTMLIETVNDVGLSAAIIQKKGITERHLSTAFWVGLALGAALFAVGLLASPSIAAFFGEPLLAPIIVVLSLNFIFGSFGIVHRTLLMKRIDFRKIAATEVWTAGIGGVVSLVLAFLGYGVWSLVFGSVLAILGSSALLWVLCPWRPQRSPDRESFLDLFGYGRNAMASQVLGYIGSNIDYFLIAKFLDATSLGLYTLAFQMAVFPFSRVSRIIGRVTFPAFSAIQDDTRQIIRGYLKTVRYTSLLTFPMLAGLAVVAPVFIPLAIGEKWAPMVLPLQILSVYGILKSVEANANPVLMGMGRPDLYVRYEILSLPTISLAIYLGMGAGITGVAAAVTLAFCGLFFVIQTIANRIIGLNYAALAGALLPAAVGSGVMVAAVRAFLMISEGWIPGGVALVSAIVLGALVYTGVIMVVDGGTVEEMKSVIRRISGVSA
ncbi:MOP flippase family protein [Methanofollis fontis]|uniref:MOP flippase family protein n=1 Tax=Methanofollis fontis TaxID=2052832 RepID=UPI0013EED160|nr:MOP flippase family protein [Methanofollis fontis]